MRDRSYQIRSGLTRPFTMDCGHRLWVPARDPDPEPGLTHWCEACKSHAHVPYPATGEWRADCRSCLFSRAYGSSETLAREGASRHVRSRPAHVIWLIGPDGIVDERWEETGQTYL